jgi:hypothetical protein
MAGAPRGGRPARTMVFGLVIVCGALFGFFRLYREWRTADVSGNWPQTVGTMKASSLVVRQRVGGGGHKTWTVQVAYAYSVDGKPQQGSVIHLGGFPSYDSEAEARALQARFAEGATVPVFYDPAEPANAVLEPGAHAAASSLGLGATLLGILLALGLTVVVQSYRRIKAQP